VCQRARADGRRVRALYVAPDYANPAGTRMDRPARRRLLESAERDDLILLEDSAYGFTASSPLPPLKALDSAGRVVYLGTFAKVCLPGARVGYVVADQEVSTPDGGTKLLADAIGAVKNMVTVNTSPITQAIIGGMLLEHDGSLAALGRARARLYQRNLGLLLAALDRHCPPGLSWNRPSGGFFVRARLPVPADEALLERSAATYRVLWTPMAPFHLDGSGRAEIRLSCSYLEPDEIDEGIRRLTRFASSLGG
jgi:(S)-3,5-dihydroxyphenylglycine transaminase